MDGKEFGSRRVGSVKAAVNLLDDRIADNDGPSMKKTQMDFSVNSPSKTRELHRARRDIGNYKESRWTAESGKAEAESELSNAKETMKHLSSMLKESIYKAKEQTKDIETVEKRSKGKGNSQHRRNENHEYAQVMRELEHLKKDLFKLRLDVASVLEEKLLAEKAIETSGSKIITCSRTAEVLRKEIEEANEEQVLAELARIEALKELEDFKVQREKEANDFSFKLESTRKKLKEAMEEIDASKEVEMKLALTMSDVNLLQNELNSVKEMEKKVQGDGESVESGDSTMLQTIKEELEEAKKELVLIRDEGFQFMASMDVIRNELRHVTDETTRLKKTDSSVQHLNSKLLRAKSKLEAISASEEKAKSVVISLTHALENLKKETNEAKLEKEHVTQDITKTKEEIQKTEFEIDMTEERLQGLMQDLESAKTSETLALEKLKALTMTTMKERALTSKKSSTITISKFEYEYLTNHAALAEEIADKKVAAAEAWIEALKASEKEILMETKIAQKELKETMLKEEEKMMLARRFSSDEFENFPRKREKSSSKNFLKGVSRKSIKSNGSMTPGKRAKFQNCASPAARHLSPFTLKKRKKVIPNLAKFFSGKKNTRNKL